MNPLASITVAVPTIGRTEMLVDCISSLQQSTVSPYEILILDQSGKEDINRIPTTYPDLNIRIIACDGTGIARNMNFALEACDTPYMLVTHDDCRVQCDWVEKGLQLLTGTRDHIVTGRVLPGGQDPLAVPSTNTSTKRYDFTGTLAHGALYPNNMGVDVSAALDIGGFDERPGFNTAAEDLDFSYRWLKSGKSLVYEPSLTVTHNDWRSPVDLINLYKHYARCAGRYYGKHLCQGDLVPLKQGLRDIIAGIRARLNYLKNSTPRHHDQRIELSVWVPVGIIEGIIESRRLSKSTRETSSTL